MDHYDKSVDIILAAKAKETRTTTPCKVVAQRKGFVNKDLKLDFDEETKTASVFYKDPSVTIGPELLRSPEFDWIKKEFSKDGCTIGEYTLATTLYALSTLGGYDDTMDFNILSEAHVELAGDGSEVGLSVSACASDAL